MYTLLIVGMCFFSFVTLVTKNVSYNRENKCYTTCTDLKYLQNM